MPWVRQEGSWEAGIRPLAGLDPLWKPSHNAWHYEASGAVEFPGVFGSGPFGCGWGGASADAGDAQWGMPAVESALPGFTISRSGA